MAAVATKLARPSMLSLEGWSGYATWALFGLPYILFMVVCIAALLFFDFRPGGISPYQHSLLTKQAGSPLHASTPLMQIPYERFWETSLSALQEVEVNVKGKDGPYQLRLRVEGGLFDADKNKTTLNLSLQQTLVVTPKFSILFDENHDLIGWSLNLPPAKDAHSPTDSRGFFSEPVAFQDNSTTTQHHSSLPSADSNHSLNDEEVAEREYSETVKELAQMLRLVLTNKQTNEGTQVHPASRYVNETVVKEADNAPAAARRLAKKKHGHHGQMKTPGFYGSYPVPYPYPYPYPYPVPAAAPPLYTRPRPNPLPIVSPQPIIVQAPQQPVTILRPQPIVQPTLVQPQVIAAQPQIIAAQPQVIAAQPQVIAAQPQVIAAQPQVIAAQPQVIAAQPATPATPSPNDNSEDGGVSAGDLEMLAELIRVSNMQLREDILDLTFDPKAHEKKKDPADDVGVITSDTLISVDALSILSDAINGGNGSNNNEGAGEEILDLNFSPQGPPRSYVMGFQDGYRDGFGEGVQTGEDLTSSLWCSIDRGHPLCNTIPEPRGRSPRAAGTGGMTIGRNSRVTLADGQNNSGDASSFRDSWEALFRASDESAAAA